MFKLSTQLSTQLSVQPHFCPFFATPKSNEMGTFGQPFFCLHHPPFNTSFNTPFNASFSPSLVAHERHPFNPSEPHRHTQQPHHAHHIADVSKMMPPAAAWHTAESRRKPAVPRFTLFPASTTTHTKRAARRAVFSGHAQRLHAVDASTVRCAQLAAKHHQPAVYLKPN